MTHVEAMKDMLAVVDAAIERGDWVVDGACDPDVVLVRFRKAISEMEYQLPSRPPLTEDELNDMFGVNGTDSKVFKHIARIVETAHNIY